MMTIVMAKDHVVTANFALVQPGLADAPKVIAALAKTSGAAEAPNVEALTAKQPGNARGRGEIMETAKRAPLDLAKLDVRSEEGLRVSVAAPKTEVETLRRELAAARGEPAAKPKEDFPGAVPADAKLVSLLREFTRPANDDATVDRVLAGEGAHRGQCRFEEAGAGWLDARALTRRFAQSFWTMSDITERQARRSGGETVEVSGRALCCGRSPRCCA